MSMAAAPHLVPDAISAPLVKTGRIGAAFGRRSFLLLTAGLVLLGPAFVHPRILWAMLAWDAAVLLAWLVDLRLLPRPGCFTVQREWSGALRMGGATPLRVEFSGNTRARLHFSVLADLPDELAKAPQQGSFVYHQTHENEILMAITPRRRGDVQLGMVFVRYQSPLRLAERWAHADLRQVVRVYPGTGNRDEQSLNLMRTRRIETVKRLSRRKGAGREFESLRDYRDGDVLRDVCWPATARRGHLIVKDYQIERSQPIWLVLDCGRLMRAPVGNYTKLDYAVGAALNVAEVAMFGGDRVGLLAYGYQEIRRIGLGRGEQHLRALMDQLAMVRAEPGEADHYGAAAALLTTHSRRSLVVWITDLPDSAITPEVYEGASVLLGKHLVIFAAIADPELNATAARRAESPDEIFETAAAIDVVYRRERLIASLRGRGARTVEVGSESLAGALLKEYLFLKERDIL